MPGAAARPLQPFNLFHPHSDSNALGKTPEIPPLPVLFPLLFWVESEGFRAGIIMARKPQASKLEAPTQLLGQKHEEIPAPSQTQLGSVGSAFPALRSEPLTAGSEVVFALPDLLMCVLQRGLCLAPLN